MKNLIWKEQRNYHEVYTCADCIYQQTSCEGRSYICLLYDDKISLDCVCEDYIGFWNISRDEQDKLLEKLKTPYNEKHDIEEIQMTFYE